MTVQAKISEAAQPSTAPSAEVDLAAMRRGACPTLGKPMRTGDGLLARLRPDDCRLTICQLRAIAHAAEDFGNGILEVTARGSLQIRGLTVETVAPLERAVLASGVVPASGVMVEVPPLAGLDPSELMDPRPIAEAIREAVTSHVPPLVLAPKLAVTVDGGGRFHLGAVSADVRLTAVDGERLLLAVGGDNATARPVAVVAQGEAVGAVVAVLEAIAAMGPAARGKDVEVGGGTATKASVSAEVPSFLGIQEIGPIPPSALPGISPTRGESGWRTRSSGSTVETLARKTSLGQGEPRESISPLVGEMSGRTEGGEPNTPTSTAASHPQSASDIRASITTLGIAFPYRQATAAQILSFLGSIEILGLSDIRLAPGHGLILTGLHASEAQKAEQAARIHGFWTSPTEPRANIALCAGTSGCVSAHYDTKAIAETIATKIPTLLDGSLTLHLSGCPKGCAHPSASALTLVGAPSGYGLVVNGAANAAPALYIAAKDLGIALERLASLVAGAKETGETVGDCIRRIGAGPIAAALDMA